MSDRVAPSKGAMRAARGIDEIMAGVAGFKMDALSAGKRELAIAAVIDRETKAPQMADLLRRAHVELGSEHGTKTSPHCSCPLCSDISRLLSELEVQP